MDKTFLNDEIRQLRTITLIQYKTCMLAAAPCWGPYFDL